MSRFLKEHFLRPLVFWCHVFLDGGDINDMKFKVQPFKTLCDVCEIVYGSTLAERTKSHRLLSRRLADRGQQVRCWFFSSSLALCLYVLYCNRVLYKISWNRNSNLRQHYLLSFHETTNIALTAAGHPHQKVSPPHLLFQNRAPISCTTYCTWWSKSTMSYLRRKAQASVHTFIKIFSIFLKMQANRGYTNWIIMSIELSENIVLWNNLKCLVLYNSHLSLTIYYVSK